MSDSKLYISVASTADAEIVEKKSRFIANICHAETESDAMAFVEKIKKQHFSARHNVYAFVLNNGFKKYTDDGEPSKTAGYPILEMLEKQGLTDVVCVVTRYFGGTLLGTGGLVRAYTEAAKQGIAAAGTVQMQACSMFILDVPYSLLGSVEHMLKSYGAVCEEKNFAEDIRMTVTIEATRADNLARAIRDDFGCQVSVLLKGEVYREL